MKRISGLFTWLTLLFMHLAKIQKWLIRRSTFVLFPVFFVVVALSSCESIEPINTDTTSTITFDSSPDTTVIYQDPSVPNAGGSGLPELDGDVDEVDCEQAEDICDAGDWACDDIADYCDYGPDDGSELPDDWDWDQ